MTADPRIKAAMQSRLGQQVDMMNLDAMDFNAVPELKPVPFKVADLRKGRG